MAVKFTNNAKTTLASGINSSVTTATVTDGSVFPTLGSGEHFYCTFDDGTNNEIVKVTARSGNTLTIVRGVDNTTARSFSASDAAELRATSALLTDIQENIAAKSANQTVYSATTASSATSYDIGIDPGVEANASVFLNGVYQHHNTFSFSGSTLTFDTAPPNGMALEVLVDNLVNLQSSNLTVDTFTAADVGGNPQTDFTLSDAPAAEDNLLVFIDGVFQDQDAYTISNQTLTITDGVTADFGVTVYVINPVNIGTPSDGTVTSSKLSGNITMPADLTVTGDVAFDSPTFVVDNANSRVGIGTASPSTLLDIVGDVNMSANLTVDTSTLVVDATNNRVGIGTTSPDVTLDVVGNARFDSVAGNALRLDRVTSGNNIDIDFYNPIGTAGVISRIRTDGDGLSNLFGAISFHTGTTPDSPTEAMRINRLGNVTINNSGTIPTGVLLGRQLVVGSSTGSEVIAFREDTSVAVGDKVGAFLIGNSDTDGAEDHLVGMWGKVSSTNGSQDLHFAAGRSGYEGDSPQMTLDSSGNLLVGTTDDDLGITDGDSGVFLNPNGYIQTARDSVFSLLYLNKLNNDGSHIDFYKDGSQVGSIGTQGSSTYIAGASTGLRFAGVNIMPSNSAGAFTDNTSDLGGSTERFKDLYLSNGVDLNRADGGTQVQVAMKQAGTLKSQLTSNFGDSKFYLYHQGGNRLVIDSSGNTGIGTTSISNLLQVAGAIGLNHAAMNSGATTGDFSVTVSGLATLNGSAWKQMGFLVFYSGVDGTLANQNMFLSMIRLVGLSTYASSVQSNIVGTATISDSSASSTGVTINFDVGNSNQGSVYVLLLGGHGNRPNISISG